MERRGRRARIERSDARSDSRERGLRLSATLVEPDAERDERGGAGERELHAGGLAEPAVVHSHDHEEDSGDDDGDTTDPAENAAAKDLLEIAWGGARRDGRPRLYAPRRRERSSHRRRCRNAWGTDFEEALEGFHPGLEKGEALLDHGFHGSPPWELVIAFLLCVLIARLLCMSTLG